MKKKKVMVVDDEQDFLKVVQLNLEGTGKYEVLTLSSAEDLVSQVHSFQPDVILLDIMMPGTGGIEACEMLNRDSAGSNIPIIVISGLEKESDKLNAYKKGILDYLVKPIDRDTLIAKIEKVLEYKQEELL